MLIGRMVALVRKGSDTTTRTGIETAGSGKDLGFWFWPLIRGLGRAFLYLSIYLSIFILVLPTDFFRDGHSRGNLASAPPCEPARRNVEPPMVRPAPQPPCAHPSTYRAPGGDCVRPLIAYRLRLSCAAGGGAQRPQARCPRARTGSTSRTTT